MATGNELVLGFLYNDIPEQFKKVIDEAHRKANLPDLDVDEEDDGEEFIDFHEAIDQMVAEMNQQLIDVHHQACLRMGWTFQKKQNNYVFFNTPEGLREFATFCFEWFCDESEMGEQLTDGVFGIAVSSRYFPTFIDWESPCGTIGNIVCDPTQEMWVIAKEEIVKVFPFMQNAKWIVKERFY